MKVLLVNKFLYPKGGSETYVFEVGKMLEHMGHSVTYFGQANDKNIVGNKYNLLAKSKVLNPLELIYSRVNYKKFRELILKEKPDIIHLNNINFQLTPSVIYAARDCGTPVVWTVHDPQLVCPNHRLFIEYKGEVCTKCVHGDISNCVKNRCFDNSYIKSKIGYLEAEKYIKSNIYSYVSKFICPSRFMADMLKNRFADNRIAVLRNYSKFSKNICAGKEDYILYYGRLSEEKGIRTLLKAVPGYVKFKIAGRGPLEKLLVNLSENVEFVGFKTGDELKKLIRRAKFTVYPSEWYENCPFSIIESISFGTPVIGANIGGIPELIDNGKTGLLFEAGNVTDLRTSIERLYNDNALLSEMIENTKNCSFTNLEDYCNELIKIYKSCGV